MKKTLTAILLASLWISISEFVRNQFLVNSQWVNHYADMGLNFPSDPLNGAMWGVWSLIFAVVIFILAQKFSLLHTIILAWVIGFMMMWVVIGNLGVLPYGILPVAVPLSILEAGIAAWIIKKTGPVH